MKISTAQAAKPIQCNEYNATRTQRIHKISQQVDHCEHNYKGEHKVYYYYLFDSRRRATNEGPVALSLHSAS